MHADTFLITIVNLSQALFLYTRSRK